MHAKWLQCLILCDAMDCSTPGFSVLGILEARITEWVLKLFSNRSSHLETKPVSVFPALAVWFFTTSAIWEALVSLYCTVDMLYLSWRVPIREKCFMSNKTLFYCHWSFFPLLWLWRTENILFFQNTSRDAEIKWLQRDVEVIETSSGIRVKDNIEWWRPCVP